MLELFSPEWLASLAAIIAVDLLLAGDNAIVIALAARKLPKHLQKRTIIIGTLGAVLVRVLFVFFALQLLKIKGISIFGGLILFYVAWRLIVPPKNAAKKHRPKRTICGRPSKPSLSPTQSWDWITYSP